MHFSVDSLIKIGVSFTLLLEFVVASDGTEDDKSLKLKIGLDLTQGTNDAPTLRIRNMKDEPESRRLNDEKKNNEADEESSSESESEEKETAKDEEKKKVDLREASDVSEEDESGSDEGRVSTRGLSPDEFEPESRPRIHDRNSKGSDSE